MSGLRSWRPATVETLDLPVGWTIESTLVAASGGLLAGDFVIAAPRPQAERLELAVVDVSGKGDAASLRARPLSEVMDGFLADLPAADFLVAANTHLVGLDWEEGFATAVHLSLDVGSGAFEVRSAGHPPAVHWQADTGEWQVLDADGMVLGVVDHTAYEGRAGVLAPGDSLLLYTDGMVEVPGVDIASGIDALAAAVDAPHAEWCGLADRLVAAVGSPDDDRALLVVHRHD